MKKMITTLALISLPILVLAQDVAISKQFFTTRNTRLGASISGDWSFKSGQGNSLYISHSGNIDELKYAKNPNTSYGLGLDIYSPNSVLGFFIEGNLNNQNYLIEGNSIYKDSLSVRNVDVAGYLRFRLGKANRPGHLWLAVGGGYTFPLEFESASFINGSQNQTLDYKDGLSTVPFFSGLLGYEFIIPIGHVDGKPMYDRDSFRVLIFAKANYDLSNRFDVTYTFDSDTALGNVSNPELKFLRVSIGIKFLLRLTKTYEILKENMDKSIN